MSVRPVFAAAAAAILVAAAMAALFFRERAREQAACDQMLAQVRAASRVQLEQTLLAAGAAIVAARPQLPAAEFRALAAALKLPGGLGFAKRFRRFETGQVEADLGMRVHPDLGREERSAVVRIEPASAGMLGRDLLADAGHRQAMERARDAHAAAASEHLIFAPAFSGDALIGWTFTAVR